MYNSDRDKDSHLKLDLVEGIAMLNSDLCAEARITSFQRHRAAVLCCPVAYCYGQSPVVRIFVEVSQFGFFVLM